MLARIGPPAWGSGEVLTTPPCKKILLRNTHMRNARSGEKKHVAYMREEGGGV